MSKHPESIQETTATDDTSSAPSTRDHSPSHASIALAIAGANADTVPKSWSTNVLRLGPLSGIFCIGLVAASLLASLGILIASDGAKVASWFIQPSTFMAIFTAISNISMRYAACQGAVILWWASALKGDTLTGLHRTWTSGSSLRGAVLNGRHMGLVGIACILSTLVAIDGPLLQRASTVYNVPDGQTVSLNVTMTPEIPHGFTGHWATAEEWGNGKDYRVCPSFNLTTPAPNGGNRSNQIMSQPVNWLAKSQYAWIRNAPIDGIVQGCPGACKAKIYAPALFPSACDTQTREINPLLQYTDEAEFQPVATPLDTTSVILCPTLLLGSHEGIGLLTSFSTYPPTDTCSTGQQVVKMCRLESSIGEYDVLIQNNRIITENLEQPTLVAFANNTAVNHTFVHNGAKYKYQAPGHPSTLGGVAFLGTEALMSSFSYVFDNASTAADGYAISVDAPSVALQFAVYDGNSCPPNYTDPYPWAWMQLNKLMMYMGAAASTTHDASYLEALMDSGLSVNSVVEGQLQGDVNVYHTTYVWFVYAAVVNIISIVCVLPTYWGWWNLGRTVSFSPLEMAKAFGAPMLAAYNSNSTALELAQQTHATKVRYGLISIDCGESKLELADCNVIVTPTNRTVIDV